MQNNRLISSLCFIIFGAMAMEQDNNSMEQQEKKIEIVDARKVHKAFSMSDSYYAGYTYNALKNHVFKKYTRPFGGYPVFIKRKNAVAIMDKERLKLATAIQPKGSTCNDYSEQYEFLGEYADIEEKSTDAVVEKLIQYGPYIISQEQVPIKMESDQGTVYEKRKMVVLNSNNKQDGTALVNRIKRDFIYSLAKDKASVDANHPYNTTITVFEKVKDHNFELLGSLRDVVSENVDNKMNFIADRYALFSDFLMKHKYNPMRSLLDFVVIGVTQSEEIADEWHEIMK